MMVCVDLTQQQSKSEVNIRKKKRKISPLAELDDRMRKVVTTCPVEK